MSAERWSHQFRAMLEPARCSCDAPFRDRFSPNTKLDQHVIALLSLVHRVASSFPVTRCRNSSVSECLGKRVAVCTIMFCSCAFLSEMTILGGDWLRVSRRTRSWHARTRENWRMVTTLNCRPLSDMMISGMPCDAKISEDNAPR